MRYYGWYSNKSPGILRKAGQEGTEEPVVLPEHSSKQYRLYWAQLIQKVYELDPCVCRKCQGEMRIISLTEDPQLNEKILVHMKLWEKGVST